MVTEEVEKRDSCMTKAAPSHETLEQPYNFWRQEGFKEDLKFSTVTPPEPLSTVIPETQCGICKDLKEKIVRF